MWSVLKNLVTQSGKWIIYDKVIRKRSWGKRSDPPQTTSKGGLSSSKILLSVWWNIRGIIFFRAASSKLEDKFGRLLKTNAKIKRDPTGKTPSADKYRKSHFLPPRCYTAHETRRKLVELAWDVLPHPPYSPELAPSNLHLFPSMENSLKNLSLGNDENVKNHFNFFSSKPKSLHKNGIMKLTQSQNNVLENEGEYVIY